MINQNRLWSRIMEVAQIGRQVDGGVTRTPFTKEEKEVKELAFGFMKEAGLTIYEDAVGNLIGRKEGQNPKAPTILIGSHLDTVYNGGNFDGVLGVLGGIEVLQSMNEQGIETEHPIEVIAFTNEETTRFPNAMIGSRSLIGKLSKDDLQQKDKQGTTLADAMRQAGYDPSNISKANREKGSIKAYLELHIEQGKTLENNGLSVGIVDGIYSQLGDKFILEGEAGHAGTTSMNLRRDALMAASETMLEIEREAQNEGYVATIGQLHVHPGGINIIPGRVEFTLDLRNLGDVELDRSEKQLIQRATQICTKRKVKLNVKNLFKNSGALCEPFIQEVMKNACESLGVEPFSLSSGAGHDAMHLAELCPMGMILVRSKDGLSHHPDEYSSPEDCGDGTKILYQTVLQLAKVKLKI